MFVTLLKPGQNKNGHKNGAARKYFGPSYFVTALGYVVLSAIQHNQVRTKVTSDK